MNAAAFIIGVGPGDAELLTLKAIRILQECDVVCVPGRNPEESVAYRIAKAAAPFITEKELAGIPAPMTRDAAKQDVAHEEGAIIIAEYLDRGMNVACLSLGDPSVYCTFSYILPILREKGYPVEIIPGVTSFCAAAARLKIPLCAGGEQMHILPGSGGILPGTCVIMKSGSNMQSVKAALAESGKTVMAVENCGMEGERIYASSGEIPDDAGYFTLIIAKD